MNSFILDEIEFGTIKYKNFQLKHKDDFFFRKKLKKKLAVSKAAHSILNTNPPTPNTQVSHCAEHCVLNWCMD